jgi:hypothetical protein
MPGGTQAPFRTRIATALAAALAGAALVAAPAPVAGAHGPRTFYVSPGGSDHNRGTSPARPWRTVRRVNRAALGPGDTVLLRGGAGFADPLLPPRSGEPGTPISFASYGGGRAALPAGVWFRGRHDLAFDALEIEGASFLGHGDRIVLTNSQIFRSGMGVYAEGRRWSIAGNEIWDTGDSGLVLLGAYMKVTRNRIENTGRDHRIHYGKHGIYLRAAHAQVMDNVIHGFADNGISVRYRDSVLERNQIDGGPIGIAWFQYDTRRGVSSWVGNEISHTTTAGIYVSRADQAGRTRESFVIARNVLRPDTGRRLDLGPTLGSYTLLGNLTG